MSMGFETETLEFKKSTSELKAGVVSLASMLNKNGYGTLCFGVKDDGTVCGQQIAGKTLRDVSQEIAHHIKPQVIPTITHEILGNRDIIKIEVSGNEKPYSAYGKYYMRSADEDRELSPGALRELLVQKESYDVITRIEAERQDLKFTQLKMAFVSRGLTVNNDTFDNNTGLCTYTGKYNFMAYLLADENDISIKVVTFAGTDKSVMLRRNEYGGKCLLNAIDQVLSYVESLNVTGVRIGTHRREEERLFDFAAFKEAWQNACLHTKWEKGNPPAVYVFSDRIEVISTGGLPSDLNREEFFRGISKPVNAKLQRIFGQLGLVEQTGHGIPLIISRYGQQAFDIMENYVNVVIPFSKTLATPGGVKRRDERDFGTDADGTVFAAHAGSDRGAGGRLNDSQRKVMECIRENPAMVAGRIAVATGLSESYVRKVLADLKALGLLRRSGSRKTGHWEIVAPLI